MKTMMLILCGILATVPVCAPQAAPLPGEGVGVARSQPADKVLRAGIWELQIRYRAKGTRSEGQDGTLLKNGKTVKPGHVGDVTDTALGKMKYYGAVPAAPWDTSGWHFADGSLIKPSSFCP